MKKIKPEEYIFSCALVSGLEKTVLSEADLEKLVDAPTVNQAMAQLQPFGYGDGRELENPRAYEGILRDSLKAVYATAISVLPDASELEILKVVNDYYNIKVLLKAEAMSSDFSGLLVDTGNFDKEKLQTMLRENSFTDMTETMRKSVEEARTAFAKTLDPQEIDLIADRACYRDMLERAENTGCDFAIGYVKLSIDLLNLGTFVRLREVEKPIDFLEKVFLVGGSVELDLLKELYSEQYAQVGERLMAYGYKKLMTEGAMKAYEYSDYTLLEKLSDNMKIEYIKAAHFVPYGVEPVLAYVIAKESEVKNLRIVLSAKIAETPAVTVKERLRETYV